MKATYLKNVWVAKSYIRNSGEEVSVHRTREGAINALADCVDEDSRADVRAALDLEGGWNDHECDPRIELHVFCTSLEN